ncbi:helix-turn-helix domain-containing protein [Streptomyces sp. NPDC098781]|uniref:helix-turn-helix domain-containing protein n=1 Tax=Streptomyces sp. NPDC098781 TaxID=3366097 RepID=UPI00380994E7
MVHVDSEISSFLKVRRAALDPAELGLTHGPTRRRVTGLRREEVAHLAGLSVDYYTRIEQGRGGNISEAVLNAIGAALRMTPAELNYLHNIAQPRHHSGGGVAGQQVGQEVQQLLTALDDTVPAYVLGRALDVLAWNRLGTLISVDFGLIPHRRRNAALLCFLDPVAKELYPEWDQMARDTVAALRADYGRYPDDARLHQILGELHDNSAEFRKLWQAQAVQERSLGVRRIALPEYGELTVSYATFRPTTDPDQVLCTYTAEPGSPTARLLRVIADESRAESDS